MAKGFSIRKVFVSILLIDIAVFALHYLQELKVLQVAATSLNFAAVLSIYSFIKLMICSTAAWDIYNKVKNKVWLMISVAFIFCALNESMQLHDKFMVAALEFPSSWDYETLYIIVNLTEFKLDSYIRTAIWTSYAVLGLGLCFVYVKPFLGLINKANGKSFIFCLALSLIFITGMKFFPAVIYVLLAKLLLQTYCFKFILQSKD